MVLANGAPETTFRGAGGVSWGKALDAFRTGAAGKPTADPLD